MNYRSALQTAFIVLFACLMQAASGAAISEIEQASRAAREAAKQLADTARADAARNENATNEREKADSASKAVNPGEAQALGPAAARLDAALLQGEKVIASLQNEVKQLEDERAKLVQIQTLLTSGLVGALVTAVVAIAGAVFTAKNSKPERDLKRLAVLDKALELRKEGVVLPEDISLKYVARQPGE